MKVDIGSLITVQDHTFRLLYLGSIEKKVLTLVRYLGLPDPILLSSGSLVTPRVGSVPHETHLLAYTVCVPTLDIQAVALDSLYIESKERFLDT